MSHDTEHDTEHDAELKKLREQLSALRADGDTIAKEAAQLAVARAALETQKAETGSVRAELQDSMDLAKRLQDDVDAANDELQGATDEINRLLAIVEGLKTQLSAGNAESNRLIATHKPKSIAATSDPAVLQRAIELIGLTKSEVAKEHLSDHTVINTGGPGTTVGLSYDDRTATISAVMVGGPAFNSKKIHKGDTMLAIDGHEVKGADILNLLKGVDTPGSVVTLILQREQGETVTVKLQRMARELIADKSKLFDLFTRILDRGKKDKDADLVRYVEEATRLWTDMMLDENTHDEKCVVNGHGMQQECDTMFTAIVAIMTAVADDSSQTNQQIQKTATPKPVRRHAVQQSMQGVAAVQQSNPALAEEMDKLRDESLRLQTDLKQVTEAVSQAEAKLKTQPKDVGPKRRDSAQTDTFDGQTDAFHVEKMRAELFKLQSELNEAKKALGRDDQSCQQRNIATDGSGQQFVSQRLYLHEEHTMAAVEIAALDNKATSLTSTPHALSTLDELPPDEHPPISALSAIARSVPRNSDVTSF